MSDSVANDTVTVTTKRLSVCPCGYPILNAGVPLGTEYQMEVGSEVPATLKCGGCGKLSRLTWAWFLERAGFCAGYLPKKIFEADERFN